MTERQKKVTALLKEGKIRCSKCKEAKDTDSFRVRTDAPNRLTGRRASCKDCDNKTANDPIRQRSNLYKITKEKVRELLKTERCEICNKNLSADIDKCIDHCHNTGKVRGVLCKECNYGLGKFKDNIEVLTLAIKYLQKQK